MCHIHQANLARLGDERFLSLECICRWFCLFKMAGPSRKEKYKVEEKMRPLNVFVFEHHLARSMEQQYICSLHKRM